MREETKKNKNGCLSDTLYDTHPSSSPVFKFNSNERTPQPQHEFYHQPHVPQGHEECNITTGPHLGKSGCRPSPHVKRPKTDLRKTESDFAQSAHIVLLSRLSGLKQFSRNWSTHKGKGSPSQPLEWPRKLLNAGPHVTQRRRYKTIKKKLLKYHLVGS